MRAQAVRTRRGPRSRGTIQGLYRTSANERNEWTCPHPSTTHPHDDEPLKYALAMVAGFLLHAAIVFSAHAVRVGLP